MILFIAPNPHKERQREGFLQRVMAIDLLFPDEEKVYFEDLKQQQQIDMLLRADMIYAHSIYHANKMLRLYPYFADKIITDLHGVVPEEELLADNHEMHAIMTETEAAVFEYGKYFVAVTDAMVAHFKKKYPAATKANWIVLPISHGIHDLRKRALETEKTAKDDNVVVYAGGSQPWQNVDKMVATINQAGRQYSYLMLTHSPEAFTGIKDDLRDIVTLKSVPSTDIATYYAKSTYGFVLRDDIVINRVACPTKLIEYLAYGIVPVVLFPGIGDFKAMGYRYITVEEFLRKPLTPAQVTNAVSKNQQVFAAYCSRIEQGEKALRQLFKRIAGHKAKPQQADVLLLQRELEMQEQRNTILRLEYQVTASGQKLTEYAEAVGQQQKVIAELHELHAKRVSSRVRRTVARAVRTVNPKTRKS